MAYHILLVISAMLEELQTHVESIDMANGGFITC